MNLGKIIAAAFAALTLASAVPSAAAAAQLEITASIKSSLDKTIADADSTQAGKIRSLYSEFLTLQQQEQDWNGRMKAIHTGNEEAKTALGKQIKQIDAAKLDKLEADAAQTRERYKPLFSLYTSLNKQIEAARALKNKEFSGLLRLRAYALKIPVALARLDIKAKDNAWQAAKDSTAKTAKKVRATLADIDQVNVQIKAKQSAIKTAASGMDPVWSTFKQAAKKSDAATVQGTLAALVGFSRQMNEEKQKVINLEAKISDILSAAKAQLP